MLMAQDMDDGLKRDLMEWVMSGLSISSDELRSRLGGALEAATTSERETCAKIAIAFGEISTTMGGGIPDSATVCAHRIAEAIRARTNGPQTG